jgi:hypothetical protein
MASLIDACLMLLHYICRSIWDSNFALDRTSYNSSSEFEKSWYNRRANTEAFTKMAKENKVFAERLALVDSPDEYYTVVTYLDLIEYLFHLHRTKMMDTKLWPRWKALAETLMYMPKFRKVWDKTKHVHNSDFIEFMDSL